MASILRYCEAHSILQHAMISDHLSMLQSSFRCRLLRSSTLCSSPLASDVFGYCLLAGQMKIDVQVSVSVEQECALMCLRLHKKKLAEILWESPPGAEVLLTARHHPALSRTSLTLGSVCLWLLVAR